jgi:predicted nucleic acid-binding protein
MNHHAPAGGTLSWKEALQAIEDLKEAGVIIREEMDTAMLTTAAHVTLEVRAAHAKSGISVPDSFAVALSKRVGVAVVTSDHKEFGPVQDLAFVESDLFETPVSI